MKNIPPGLRYFAIAASFALVSLASYSIGAAAGSLSGSSIDVDKVTAAFVSSIASNGKDLSAADYSAYLTVMQKRAIDMSTAFANLSLEIGKMKQNATSTGATTGGNGGTTTGGTGTNGVTTGTATPVTCAGVLPTGKGVKSTPYSQYSLGGGSTPNTEWRYGNPSCGWTCEPGYAKDGEGCKARAPGEGVTVTVLSIAGNPVSGVTVDSIQSLILSTSVVGSYVTDSSGKTPEYFHPETNGTDFTEILKITKAGYKIERAEGCTSRITRDENFCDSPSGHNITIYVSKESKPTGNESTRAGNTLSNLGGSACANKELYVVLDGVNRDAPPKGCAKPTSNATSCTKASDFRDYASSEWASDTRIVASSPANSFPVGSYSFYVMYGETIRPAGAISIIKCN